MKTRATSVGINLQIIPQAQIPKLTAADLADVAGVLVQYPDTFGVVADFKDLSTRLHAANAMLVVATDPLALCKLSPPGTSSHPAPYRLVNTQGQDIIQS